MVVHPNKPILFGVDHDPEAVDAAIGEFRKLIKGKKTLYIEGSPSFLRHTHRIFTTVTPPTTKPEPTDFERLILEAYKQGLDVVPLDSEKDMRELMKAEEELQKELKGFSLSKFDTLKKLDQFHEMIRNKSTRRFHTMYDRREKRWERTLEGTRSDSVIVMHPAHATRMAEKLKLPKANTIIRWHPGIDLEMRRTGYIQTRRMTDAEEARIQKERLERRKRSAQQRWKQKTRRPRKWPKPRIS